MGTFKNIKRQYVLPLIQAGLESKEDFAKVTQAEVLAIDGIGKKTIEHLLEKGVEFAD